MQLVNCLPGQDYLTKDKDKADEAEADKEAEGACLSLLLRLAGSLLCLYQHCIYRVAASQQSSASNPCHGLDF